MALPCCLRACSFNSKFSFLKRFDIVPISSIPRISSTRRSSSVSPIFAEYHRKREKEWERGKGLDGPVDEKLESSQTTLPSDPNRPPPETKVDRLMYTMPEFVPTTYWGHRDSVRESLERVDLLKRRAVMKIPEFYVGSILSVTVADPYSPTKLSKFIGICIAKGDPGLRHRFVLRNVVDEQGIEIMYELYNPMIREIVVLKLERRLDDEMYYLRDALPEYSTVPMDMKPIPRGSSEEVPVNDLLVKMKPRPWTQKWQNMGFRGIDQETILANLDQMERFKLTEPGRRKVWEKYDLVLQYRNSVTREETDQIYGDILARFDRGVDDGDEVSRSALPKDEKPLIRRKKTRRVENL